ncbi:MAG: hypothetical protein ACFCUL_01095 [Flavobacteriaceae bacterium]
MEQVHILLYALASFFSTENPPIFAKSAAIEINSTTKQIVLHQYDICTVPEYSQQAGEALKNLMSALVFVKDLESLVLTSKYFYEADGKLNASIYFQYKEMKDLQAISMYFDDGNNTLSYPLMQQFGYTAPDALFDERYIKFKADGGINFSMFMKETSELKNTVGLLAEWKQIEADKFVDIADIFSKKDFEELRSFIFKKGDRQSFRNFDNDNPHYRFEDFDVYLGTGDQRRVFENDRLKPEDYSELVIGFSRGFAVYLAPHNEFHQSILGFADGKVYTLTYTSEKMDELKKRLSLIKRTIH